MAALLVVGLLCMAALQLVNFVRTSQFNEDIVSGSLYMLAQRLEENPAALTELSALFDADMRLLQLYDAANDLDEYQINRLLRGQALIFRTNQGRSVRLLKALSEQRLLYIELNAVTDIQAQAAAFLLMQDYRRSGLVIEDFLKTMQPHFGFPLKVMHFDDLFLTETDIGRLFYGDILVRISIEGNKAEALAKIPGSPAWLRRSVETTSLSG